MLEDILEAIFIALDITGNIAGEENESPIFKIFGIVLWFTFLAGIVLFIISWIR